MTVTAPSYSDAELPPLLNRLDPFFKRMIYSLIALKMRPGVLVIMPEGHWLVRLVEGEVVSTACAHTVSLNGVRQLFTIDLCDCYAQDQLYPIRAHCAYEGGLFGGSIEGLAIMEDGQYVMTSSFPKVQPGEYT